MQTFYRQFHSPAGGLDALLPLPLLSLLFPRMQLPGSAFQATSHDDTHDAFMTLPAYACTREDEAHHLRSRPKSCRVVECRQLGRICQVIRPGIEELMQNHK